MTALVTRPRIAIMLKGSNREEPAMRQLKWPRTVPSAWTVTPNPNWEKGVTPSTVPLPPPFATVGPAADAVAGMRATAARSTSRTRIFFIPASWDRKSLWSGCSESRLTPSFCLSLCTPSGKLRRSRAHRRGPSIPKQPSLGLGCHQDEDVGSGDLLVVVIYARDSEFDPLGCEVALVNLSCEVPYDADDPEDPLHLRPASIGREHHAELEHPATLVRPNRLSEQDAAAIRLEGDGVDGFIRPRDRRPVVRKRELAAPARGLRMHAEFAHPCDGCRVAVARLGDAWLLEVPLVSRRLIVGLGRQSHSGQQGGDAYNQHGGEKPQLPHGLTLSVADLSCGSAALAHLLAA